MIALALGLAAGSHAPAQALDNLTLSAPGGGDALAGALREASLLVAAEADGVTDPQELLAAARADYGRLVAVLYDSGRFGGSVDIRIDGREAADIAPLNAPGRIGTIAIRVTPGPVYKLSRAEIAPLAPGTELPEGFAIGQPARTGTLRAATSAAVEAWRRAGRAKATVGGQQLVVDHAPDTLSARVEIAPGPRVTFGDLLPRGQTRVRPARITAIAGLPTGEVYDPAAVEAAATRLRRTGTFSSVALREAESLGAGDTLDVTALVNEAKPRRLGFGAEVSSVDGLTLSGFWLHRNFLGGAERLRLEGEVAQLGTGNAGEDYSFDVEFTRPATLNPDTDFFATGTVEQLNEPSFTSQSAEVAAGFSRILSPSLTVKAGVGYRYSRIGDSTGTRIFRFVPFPLRATQDRRDDQLNPAAGYFADVELAPFVGLAGTDSGARLTFDARYYRGFGAESRVVLAGRLQGGSIVGASAAGVPDDYLFFSGGGGTVRGQSYQSLGVPVGGVQTGGLSYLAAQAEARVGVTDKIDVVAFFDWGTVSDEAMPGGPGQSHSGAGLGVRYNTPIGPVRLDLAAPVDGPVSGGDMKIYIGIGQAF